jgi:hypothetical protein
MDLLNSLMGGGRERDQAQDFVNRYDNGAPYDGISGDEAYQQYNRVAPHLSQQDYEMSAEEAFSRMAPRERQQFAQMLSQQARQQGTRFQDLDGDGVDDRMQQDPRYLAQAMGRMQQQQPGLLQQLMGGGGGAMGGAMGGGGAGNLLANPLAKAALGGIAAMAMRRMMSGGGGGQRGGGNPFGGGGISM